MTKTLTRTAILSTLLAGLSTPALAQASYEPWEGTWETTYGEVRLVEQGDYVYGDYGTVGTIQGILSEDKSKLRGVFIRSNGNVGYIEWVQSGDDGNRFVGRWKWQNNGLPQWDSEKGGDRWRGDRRNSATPRLVMFNSGMGRSAFLVRQTSAYRSWTNFPAQARSSASSSTTPAPAPVRTQAPSKPWLNKVPYLRTVGSAPKWVDIKMNRVGMGLDEARTYEIYGTLGLYAYCETPSGTRALRPFYGNSNRVLDRPRSDARTGPIKFSTNQATLRFAFDEACLKENGGRLSFQLQTNLAEKDTIRRLDEDFGYRGWKFYMEDLPTDIRLINWGGARDGIKLVRESATRFEFRHIESLNGRLLGERMYFYGEVDFTF